MHLLGVLVFLQTEKKKRISLPFHIFQLVKSLPFHVPETWKRYLFRAEPPRIYYYREYPTGSYHTGM